MKTMNLIYKTIALILICVLITSCVKSIILASKKDDTIVLYNNVVSNTSSEIVICVDTQYNNITKPMSLSYGNDNYIINKKESVDTNTDNENTEDSIDNELVETIQNDTDIDTENVEKQTNDKYSKNEIYELAKIIMCEAEGESQKCKEYVGQVVLNRVKAKEFPNTIHGVIFDGYQFSPTFDGRWEKVEPNQDCYDAAYKVINADKPLTKALYFEACRNKDSWHARNLTQVAEIDNTRFYIE